MFSFGSLAISRGETHGFASRPRDRFALIGELRLSSADWKMCELPMWHLKYGVHFPHCQTENPFRGNRYLLHDLACALRLRTQDGTRRDKNHPVHFVLAAEE